MTSANSRLYLILGMPNTLLNTIRNRPRATSLSCPQDKFGIPSARSIADPGSDPMKVCTKCGEEKPISEFYIDLTHKDGHRDACKVCTCKWQTDYSAANREKIRARARMAYAKRPERQASRSCRYRRSHRKRITATNKANYAKRKGLLVKRACERCGSTENIDSHHDDYDKPLDVRWLCRSCHKRLHGELRRKETA